ncbi:biotin transport system substrate-specific component [Amycolatopsis bartoniae]|uniref:Biotin transporter n=1 Tax=Amycolatopsis bartoniae TaxID=941986 RepID=A0A8H9MCF3_9PSEU|nr:biotin transporter BioY [Amycolatopsis bartoniae]MBB2940061.1 biotin transport system substrate-specific component [Amycolatopsis bartoniae]TVT09458.1 biotin transporter BioY [Amycolatopsis bartoniae]GHF53673.1 BioY family transporter [Amycolatopsis bartoniae]
MSSPISETTPPRGGLLPRDLALIALFAALIAVLGLPGSFALFGAAVPITAQSLGVMLAGSVLGARRGTLAVLTFLVLVAAGLPLLPGGRGGVAVFAGASAGYLVGWLLGAFVTGWLVTKVTRRRKLPWLIVANVLGGIVAIYLIGIPVTAWRVGSGLVATVVSAVQYLPGDAIKVVVSALITAAVYRAYPVPEAGRRRGEE